MAEGAAPEMLPPTREHMLAALPLLRDRVASGHDDWQPWGCDDCPFGAKATQPYEEIWNDPSEAYYVCPCARPTPEGPVKVWGERPICAPYMRAILLAWLDCCVQASALAADPSPEPARGRPPAQPSETSP